MVDVFKMRMYNRFVTTERISTSRRTTARGVVDEYRTDHGPSPRRSPRSYTSRDSPVAVVETKFLTASTSVPRSPCDEDSDGTPGNGVFVRTVLSGLVVDAVSGSAVAFGCATWTDSMCSLPVESVARIRTRAG